MCNGPDNILWWFSNRESTCSAGDPGLLSGSGRAAGEENDNPLQYFCLGNLMDRGAWWAAVYGSQRVGHSLVTKQQQQQQQQQQECGFE